MTGAERQLYTLNPLATLERGYAIVHHNDAIVTNPAQLQPDDLLNIRVRDGEFNARVA